MKWISHVFGTQIAAAMVGLTSVVAASTAHGVDVQEVVSPSGIRAYLVSEPTIPFLSMTVHFKGGAAMDPPGKEGLAYMIAGLLDEGAGSYDSQAFRSELEDNAIQLSFDADRDSFSGSLTTLTETREHAFELLRLALTEPRFDEEPIERIRGQIVTSLTRRENDPDYVSARTWFSTAFPDHPYGRPTRGTVDSIGTIAKADFETFVAERIAKDNLIVGVAGDIDAETLAALLDSTFGTLPDAALPVDVSLSSPVVDALKITPMDVPQSVVTFGVPGIRREDPDYYATYVANHILGGGGFGSWLMEEVREKRGLAYSVYSYLYQADLSPLILGGVSTRNDQVAQSIEIIREQFARLARGEVTEVQLTDAKTYLTGSFPLHLTSNGSIAGMLVGMQVADLGTDYLDERNALIEAVSLDDIKRVAAAYFDAPLLVSVVGQPIGLDG